MYVLFIFRCPDNSSLTYQLCDFKILIDCQLIFKIVVSPEVESGSL
jgi:hypothetical protein